MIQTLMRKHAQRVQDIERRVASRLPIPTAASCFVSGKHLRKMTVTWWHAHHGSRIQEVKCTLSNLEKVLVEARTGIREEYVRRSLRL